MALYAFDGTGNEEADGIEKFSNVLDFFNAYDQPENNPDPNEPGSLYLKGIGTRAKTRFGEKLSMAFGIGGHKRIKQALERLEANFEDGDTDIDIVGFSRGAALAVSFANKIAKEFGGLQIRFIGVWDIVGQFGLPGRMINAGHDLSMPSNVDHVYHAMALDETRALFPLTRLAKGYQENSPVELWFRGVHSDVGGGNANHGLNWISLNWMFKNALRHDLPIRKESIEANQGHKDAPRQISDHKLDLKLRREILPQDRLHTSVELTPGTDERPHNNPTTELKRADDDGPVN